MAESKPLSSETNEEEQQGGAIEGINALNLLGIAREGIEALLQEDKSSSSSKTDIIDDVKAPNLFERAKEEIDAIVHTIQTNEHQKNDNQLESSTRSYSEADSKADSVLMGKFDKVANLIERGKGKIAAIIDNMKEEKSANEHQQSETRGLGDDVDEKTPLNEVKAPNLFARAKEELGAIIVNAIQQKKESSSTNKEIIIDDAGTPGPSSSDGFWLSVGRQLEKCCSPFDHKKD